MSFKIPTATVSFVPARAARTSPSGVMTSTSLSSELMASGPLETIRSQCLRSSLASARRRWSSVSRAKPTTQRRPFCATERGDDVVGFDEVQVDRLARLGDLVRLDAHRAVIAGSGGADQAVAVFELACRGGEHVFGRNHRDDACRGG